MEKGKNANINSIIKTILIPKSLWNKYECAKENNLKK